MTDSWWAWARLASVAQRGEILLCEPVPNRTVRDDLPRLGTYQLPVLRVHLGSKRRDLVLASPYRAVTPLPWYLQGAKGLSLLAPDPSAVTVRMTVRHERPLTDIDPTMAQLFDHIASEWSVRSDVETTTIRFVMRAE